MEIKMKEISFEFENFVTIRELCEDALDNSLFLAVKGAPGYGKTYAAKMFCEEHPGQTTYIKFNESTIPSSFFGQIIVETEKAMGRNIKIDSLHGHSIYDLSRRAVYNLTNTSGKYLLVVDEAGKLKYLHELRDDSMGLCGLVILGPSYYQDKLDNLSHIDGIPELLSRIEAWITLREPNANEKKSMCKGHGITNEEDIALIVRQSVSFRDCYNKIKLLKIRKKRAKAEMAMIAN